MSYLTKKVTNPVPVLNFSIPKPNQMNSYFETSKQEILKELHELIVEIELKNEAEFNKLVNSYKGEEDPAFVALCHMLYIDDSRLNRHLKTIL